MPEITPSATLQRLLAIDKTFDTFEQRIDEIYRILRLRRQSSDDDCPIHGKTGNTGRVEFALKWLVEKLNSGPESRQTPAAWDLLFDLVRAMPSSTLLRAPGAASLGGIMTTTMAELFPLHPDGSIAAGSTLDREPESVAATHTTTTKKRKRSDKHAARHSDNVPQSICDGGHGPLISTTITKLMDHFYHDISRAEPSQTPIAPNQIRKLLRLDPQQRMIFARHYLFAIDTRLAKDSSQDGLANAISRATTLLNVWHLQPSPLAADLDSYTAALADNCLLPLTHLLQTVSRASDNDPTTRERLRTMLEAWLSKLVIRPLHAAFDHQSSSRLSSDRTPNTLFFECTRTLHSQLDTPGEHSPASKEKSYNLLPSLLDLFLQHTPLDTVKRRREEQPWIDACFSALLPQQISDATVTRDAQLRTIVNVLEVCVNRDVAPSPKSLSRLIDDWTGSTAKVDQSSADHSLVPKLIAVIIRMDANLFAEADSPHLPRLLEAMTEHSSSSASEDNANAQNLRKIWLEDIAVPLLRAFARARRLETFLSHWHACLLLTPTQSLRGSVWTDSRLQTTLVDLLEPSLDLRQVLQLIPIYTKPLQEAASSSTAKRRPAKVESSVEASIILLNAIVGALTTDEFIDGTLPALTDIAKSLYTIASSTASIASLSLAYWTLLQKVERRVRTYGPQTQDLPSILDSSSLGVAWKLLSTAEFDSSPSQIESVIDYVLLLLDMAADNLPDASIAREQLQCFFDGKTKVSSQSNARCIVDRHPQLLVRAFCRVPRLIRHLDRSDFAALLESLYVSEQAKSEPTHDLQAVVERLLVNYNQGSRMKVSIEMNDDKGKAQDAYVLAMKRFKSLELPVDYRLTSSAIVTVRQILQKRLLKNKKANHASLDKSLAQMAAISETRDKSKHSDTVYLMLHTLANTLDEAYSTVQDREMSTTRQLFGPICDGCLSRESDKVADGAWKEDLNTLLRGDEPMRSPFKLALFCRLLKHPNNSTEIGQEIELLLKSLYKNLQPQNSVMDQSAQTACYLIATLPPSWWISGKQPQSQSFIKIRERLNQIMDIMTTDWAIKEESHDMSICMALWSDPILGDMLTRYALAHAHDADAVVVMALHMLSTKSFKTGNAHTRNPRVSTAILSSLEQISCGWTSSAMVTAVSTLMDIRKSVHGAARYAILQLILPRITRALLADSDIKPALDRVVPTLITGLGNCQNAQDLMALSKCMVMVMKEKVVTGTFSNYCHVKTNAAQDFMLHQHAVERLLSEIQKIVSITGPRFGASAAPSIYQSLCAMVHAVLQHQRRRLGGRLHIVVPLMMQLLACLFTGHGVSDANKTLRHPPWLESSTVPLGPEHAQRFARLLTLLCDPPQSIISSHSRRKGITLVDETRRARIHVSQHMHHVIHAFCRYQMYGKLSPAMREALMPGVWAIMEVMDMDSASRAKDKTQAEQRVRALGASMTKSELALLRREWEAWRTFGAWKG